MQGDHEIAVPTPRSAPLENLSTKLALFLDFVARKLRDSHFNVTFNQANIQDKPRNCRTCWITLIVEF